MVGEGGAEGVGAEVGVDAYAADDEVYYSFWKGLVEEGLRHEFAVFDISDEDGEVLGYGGGCDAFGGEETGEFGF